MKLLKRSLFFTAIILAVLISVCAAAEAKVFNSVKVYFGAIEIPTIVEEKVVFELYDGDSLLSTKSHSLKRGTPGFEIEFSVPEYSIGKKFRFVVKSGAKGALHNGVESTEHILETYSTPDSKGGLKYQTSFYMSLLPNWNKEAVIKIEGVKKTLYYHCLTDDEVYVTVDLLSKLGINVKKSYNEAKPYFTLSTDKSHSARFYLNDIYAIIGGKGQNLAAPTFELSSMPYVPLSKVAVYFACNYKVTAENEYYREISLTPSAYSPAMKKATTINSRNISSKTDYMIWVSKKDFEVNIFKGSKNNWTLVTSFPCSIGKPSTPTVEGQFEYYQYQARWSYAKYYCGPVMRFYNGYAFHSYLIKYDGTPYDARLGMQVSAGCVRMHPDDITWMTKNIPMKTKVYITP